MSLQRAHPLFLALLLILAAASWVMLIWQSRMMKSMGMGLTMGMGATVFLAIWVVMMIAMMFPTTAPMNLVFARVQRERHSGRRPSVSTWIFVGAYPAFLDALRRGSVSRRAHSLGTGRAGSLDHAERNSDRRQHLHGSRALSVRPPQARLPGKMLHASGVHPWFLA